MALSPENICLEALGNAIEHIAYKEKHN